MSWYSLWRGDALLGWFEERAPMMHHGKRVGATGILVPNSAEVALSSLMQTRISIFPGQPVFQTAMDSMVLGEPPATSSANPGPQELQPMSPEEARGVPPHLALSVRDAEGVTIDATMITLWLMVIPEHVDLAAVSAANGRAITSRQLWHVSYAGHEDAT